jgi:hypothetical protein
VPEPIDFVGVDVAVVRREDLAVFLDAVLDFGAQRLGPVRLDQIAIDRAFDFLEIA